MGQILSSAKPNNEAPTSILERIKIFAYSLTGKQQDKSVNSGPADSLGLLLSE